MLSLLPLASSLHAADQVQASLAGLRAELCDQGVPHQILEPGSGIPDALLILTGGTEHQALTALGHVDGPVLLLVHPHQNSLPAAMEILAWARQQGRRGRIVPLEECGRLARLLEIRRHLRGMRLGRIGAPSEWLVASRPDPGVLEATWGAQIVDLTVEELRSLIPSSGDPAADTLKDSFVQGARNVREPSASDLSAAAGIGVALRRLAALHRLDACTLRCFDLVMDLRTTGCLALSALLDDGIVAGCEGDVPAALTMAWMQAATGGMPFMANPQDVDPGTGSLWLAHCTIARSMARGYALRSHFESSLGVGIQGELEPGPVTLARIGGTDLRSLFVADGELLENGESELRCRTQIRIRLEGDVRELLERPLGNHLVLVRGHWAGLLREYHGLFVG